MNKFRTQDQNDEWCRNTQDTTSVGMIWGHALVKENRWCQRKWSEACVILKTEDVIVNRDCGRTIPDSYITLMDKWFYIIILIYSYQQCTTVLHMNNPFMNNPFKVHIQLFQLRLSWRKGKRSKMSAKSLSGKTSFIPEYITMHVFSTKLKIRSCFLMNINPQKLNFVLLVYF